MIVIQNVGFSPICSVCSSFVILLQMIRRFEQETKKKSGNDFVECLVYSENSGVIMTGVMTDDAEADKVSDVIGPDLKVNINISVSLLYSWFYSWQWKFHCILKIQNLAKS